MKSRLTASISFLAGGRSRSICRTVPVQRIREALNFSLPCLGVGSSNRSSHSSSKEDDSFAELGPTVNKSAFSQLKLATEKPERFMWQDDSVRKRLFNKIPLGNKCGEKSTRNESGQSMGQLVDAFSANSPTDTIKVNSIGALDDESGQYTDEPTDAFAANGLTRTIRINVIGEHGVSIQEMHSLCRNIGNLEGLRLAGKEAVDAVFKVRSKSDSKRIIERLNSWSIDGSCRLSASVLSSDSTRKEVDWPEIGLKLSNTIDELRKQMDMKKIYYEDLEMLHNGIMHIQCPPAMND